MRNKYSKEVDGLMLNLKRLKTDPEYREYIREKGKIEIVHMLKKNQLNTQEQSMFKSFYSLAA